MMPDKILLKAPGGISRLIPRLLPPLCLCMITALLSACSEPVVSAYQQDMQQLQQNIAKLNAQLGLETDDKNSNENTEKEAANKNTANIPPPAIIQAPGQLLIKLSELYHKKAVLTGRYQDYQKLELLLNKMSGQLNNPPALRYAKANFNAGMHRFDNAISLLDSLPPQAQESTPVRALRLDIALQLGQYRQAESQLQALIADAPGWENLVRLAHYSLNTGEPDRARALYQQAGEMLSAKQLYQYAWVKLQQGLLELEQENYDLALAFYQTADRAYSGYWLIEEHIAEILTLTGKKQEAEGMYRALVSENPNPELKLALADLLLEQNGQTEEAEQLHNEAMAEFTLRQQMYPEAAAGHFVERLLTLEQTHPALLSSAQLNFNARPNADSKTLLAKSYLKLGQTKQAEQLYRQILSTPWRNPGIEELARGLEKTLE
ncbi:tetratricopeptide repeat protein [Thalassomonas actiniarum]|uniref:Tetratricopeptide repeat protein n=1 Tax=Thalassomonas actiniarum TaxID=485447 RepID=A0AAE9YN86_9GAMM|nr:tetratricopeptide repeat protein [Thalassomonas actiniarum]WDD97483.1 tetratricopeptide repeat protein [Thalassomonas actiniarum]